MNTLISNFFDLSEDLLCVVDLEGTFLRVNPAWEHFTGLSSNEIAKINFSNFIYKEDFEKTNELYEKSLEKKQSNIHTFFRLLNKKNEPRWINWTSTIDYKNQVSYCIGKDITEMRLLEDERRETEGKMIASSKMSALGEMVGGIAHEINNPLSIIYGKSGHLKFKLETSELSKESLIQDLSKIESMAERISKIIRSLHAFSRSTEQEDILEHSVKSIIDTTLEICKEKYKNNSVKLIINCPAEITIECRSTQISQVIMNLLNNSYDAIQNLNEKWIKIDVTEIQDRLELSVTDSGLGVPTAYQEKLMQPFFTTKEYGKGTGLGLNISKGLIEKHHGTLRLDKNSRNTRFVIDLPIQSEVNLRKTA